MLERDKLSDLFLDHAGFTCRTCLKCVLDSEYLIQCYIQALDRLEDAAYDATYDAGLLAQERETSRQLQEAFLNTHRDIQKLLASEHGVKRYEVEWLADLVSARIEIYGRRKGENNE